MTSMTTAARHLPTPGLRVEGIRVDLSDHRLKRQLNRASCPRRLVGRHRHDQRVPCLVDRRDERRVVLQALDQVMQREW